MTAFWDEKIPQEFTFPATVGLAVVLVTVTFLFVLQSRSLRSLTSAKGSKFVVDTDGAQIVRRSTRSVRKPSRFEPVLHGQGGESTPSKEGTPASPVLEKLTPKLQRTPKAVAEAIKVVAGDSPAAKRGPGRPKRGGTLSDSASPTVSPARTRRTVRSPS